MGGQERARTGRAGLIGRFGADRRGGVAIIFSLALLPMLGLVGAAVDYARATRARVDLQRAVDGTAVMLMKGTAKLSPSELETRGRAIFQTYAGSLEGSIDPLIVRRDGQGIRVEATGSIKTGMAGVLGLDRFDLAAASRSQSDQKTIELALVLDNTGSMAGEKIAKLKQAVSQLLDTIETATGNGDLIKVSIVPFDTQVRVDPNQRYASWMRPLTQADIEPSKACGALRVNDAKAKAALLPATGADPEKTGRDAWNGYLTERARETCDPKSGVKQAVNHNTRDTKADSLYPETLYAMVKNEEGKDLAPIVPLSTDFKSGGPLRASVGQMIARGCTNITLGTMWGLETLSPNLPLDQAAAYGAKVDGKAVEKIMIVLTDGWNTRDGFRSICGAGEGDAQLDARTQSACDLVKSRGVTLYTIRFINGSEKLLGNCASTVTDEGSPYYRGPKDPQLFYPVDNVSQLSGVFQSIVNQILQTRLTH